ncbi:MAG: DEAD/DEAH box helicase [Pirellulales bacterium]|nr:DEAD/DEAH box helicase [Pirellulales bacterium]
MNSAIELSADTLVAPVVEPATPLLYRDMPLSPAMQKALEYAGYTSPTPIQAGLIPVALAGGDVLGQARTGTGKTAAFVIPVLERIKGGQKHPPVQVLILVPTRELAVQVKDEVEKLSHGQHIHCVPLYGGKPIKAQITKMQKGCEVVVGTPGRVLDHLGRGTLKLDQLTTVVLDEADRMLDIGFRPDIEKILKRCPTQRQTLLLSATVPPPVEKLAKRYMIDPQVMNFSPKDISHDTIEQFYFTVDADRKFDLLCRLLFREKPRQAIIFCRTKRGTDKVYTKLAKKLKHQVGCIHGDLGQGARDRVMAGFRAGTVLALVATDVVGRGIDVSGISHIINYDVPEFCDDYVHRVGRTGRMGREGVAYTFVTPEEGPQLTRIEVRINKQLIRDEIEGFAAVSRPHASPVRGKIVGDGFPSGEPEESKISGPANQVRKKYRRAL